jgi:hypothetical protein
MWVPDRKSVGKVNPTKRKVGNPSLCRAGSITSQFISTLCYISFPSVKHPHTNSEINGSK